MYQPNEFRVFVSSTFIDMHTERDHLNKEVFNELANICQKRCVNFTAIDLRWGINEDQSKRNETINICLEEIDKCHPFFIGIVGNRYGWIPPEEALQATPLLASNPQLLDHIKDKSITEIEFIRALLAAENNILDARFYFRNPEIDTLDKGQVFERETESNFLKLQNLKNTIRNIDYERIKSGENSMLYEGYSSPEELGERIKHDLLQVIDKYFPVDPNESSEEAYDRFHKSFSMSRLRSYIPNRKDVECIEEFIATDNSDRLLLIKGAAGSGKSSIASYAAQKAKEFAGGSIVVVEHYAEVERIRSEHRLVTRLVRLLASSQGHSRESIDKLLGNLEDDVEPIPHEIAPNPGRDLLDDLIRKDSRTVLIVIDGIDCLDKQGIELGWLPTPLPRNVKLIITCESGDLYKALKNSLEDISVSPEMEHSMAALDRKAKEGVLIAFSARYGKSLTSNQQEKMVSSCQTSSPIFLISVLEEIRLYGRVTARSSEGVTQAIDVLIDSYLAHSSIRELYDHMIVSREEYFSSTMPGLVQKVLSFLYYSMEGLTEQELTSLVSEDPKRSQSTPSLEVLAVLNSFGHHLTRSFSSSGVVKFSHPAFREAVKRRYSLKSTMDTALDRKIFNMFLDHPDPARRREEINARAQKIWLSKDAGPQFLSFSLWHKFSNEKTSDLDFYTDIYSEAMLRTDAAIIEYFAFRHPANAKMSFIASMRASANVTRHLCFTISRCAEFFYIFCRTENIFADLSHIWLETFDSVKNRISGNLFEINDFIHWTAQSLIHDKKYEEAFEVLLLTLTSPSSSKIRVRFSFSEVIYVCIMLKAQGQTDKSRALCVAAAKRSGLVTLPIQELFIGELLLEFGEYELSEDVFRHLINSGHEKEKSLIHLAEIRDLTKRSTEAYPVYKELLKLEKDNIESVIKDADEALEKGLLAKAEILYEHAIRTLRESKFTSSLQLEECYEKRAEVLEKLGNIKDAEQCFLHALELITSSSVYDTERLARVFGKTENFYRKHNMVPKAKMLIRKYEGRF